MALLVFRVNEDERAPARLLADLLLETSGTSTRLAVDRPDGRHEEIELPPQVRGILQAAIRSLSDEGVAVLATGRDAGTHPLR